MWDFRKKKVLRYIPKCVFFYFAQYMSHSWQPYWIFKLIQGLYIFLINVQIAISFNVNSKLKKSAIYAHGLQCSGIQVDTLRRCRGSAIFMCTWMSKGYVKDCDTGQSKSYTTMML